MLRANITVSDHTDLVGAAMDRAAVRSLNAAAIAAALAGDRAANSPKPIARFETVPARRVFGGFASGMRAGPLVRIFDKGSLAEHAGRLKRPGKPTWQVNRGTNPYTAHRRDLEAGAGVPPRRILAAARKAGRAALIRGLRGH
jgi:hypothetical protein